MDIAAVLSVLGRGLGRSMPQAAEGVKASDAGLAFSDTLGDLAEAPSQEQAQGNRVDGGESGAAAQVPLVMADTMQFSSPAVPLIPEGTAVTVEESRFHPSVPGLNSASDGVLPMPLALSLVAGRAEGEAVTLPASPDGKEHPTASVGKVAQGLEPVSASKGQMPPQFIDAAPQDRAPHQPLPQSLVRGALVPDAPPTLPNDTPLRREEEGARSRRPEAAPPPGRSLPTNATDPVGAADPTEAATNERRGPASAFTDQGLIPKGAEVASGAAPEGGRRADGRADGQGKLAELASRDGKDAPPRPKAASDMPDVVRPVPDRALIWPAGSPEGGQGGSRGVSAAPEPTAPHHRHLSDPGAPLVARSPHAIGMQLADRMPATAGQPVEITLAPEELGKVRMTIWATEGGLTLQLVADRPETLDLMRRHIDQLAQDFRELGFERLSFAFGHGERQDQPPGQAAPDDPPEEGSAKPVVTPAAGPAQRSAPVFPQMPDDRLDLRF